MAAATHHHRHRHASPLLHEPATRCSRTRCEGSCATGMTTGSSSARGTTKAPGSECGCRRRRASHGRWGFRSPTSSASRRSRCSKTAAPPTTFFFGPRMIRNGSLRIDQGDILVDQVRAISGKNNSNWNHGAWCETPLRTVPSTQHSTVFCSK